MTTGSRKRRERKRKNRPRNKKYAELMSKVQANESLPDNVVLVTDSEVKMSQIIMDFAEPFLAEADTEEKFRKAVGLATVAWNAGLLPKDQWKEPLAKSLDATPDAIASILAGLKLLVTRKHQHFANNKRFIVNYHLLGTFPDFQLAIASTLSNLDGRLR